MSGNERKQVVLVEREDAGSHLAAFLVGAVIGAGVALLLAPQSGVETQKSIREGAKKLRVAAGTTVRDAQRHLGEGIEAAREGARERLGSVKDAVDAGRRAATDARRDLEERLSASKEAYKAGVEAARQAERVAEGQANDGTAGDESAAGGETAVEPA